MKILLVHPVPPETKHVSALRLWRFGSELARLGHRVLLLTRGAEKLDRGHVAAALATHDWSEPFVRFVNDATRLDTYASRNGKMHTAIRMIRDGGSMVEWVRDGRLVGRELVEIGFCPDVILPTFGSMESLLLSRRLSNDMAVPWVLDLKDSWRLYVPFGLRHLMALRTRGWRACVANGGVTAACARRFQRTQPEIIYSGVDDCFISPKPRPEHYQPGCFTINLIGGLYFEKPLVSLLAGIERWANDIVPVDRLIRVHYFGTDSERFLTAASRHLNRVHHSCFGYLDKDELAAHCQWAACNFYVSHWGGFHHKLLELLACGRPILVSPPEREESRQLARAVGAPIIEAESADGVAQGLTRIDKNWCSEAVPSINGVCARFSWPAQTKILEEVLSDVIAAA